MGGAIARAVGCLTTAVRAEAGQDAYEYILVVGSVVVLTLLGLFGFDAIVAQLLDLACPSVDTAVGVGATVGSCIQ